MDDSKDFPSVERWGGKEIKVQESDLLKLRDVLAGNVHFHTNRDRMNGAVHLAKEVRFSPLTSETMSAYDRITAILESAQEQKELPIQSQADIKKFHEGDKQEGGK